MAALQEVFGDEKAKNRTTWLSQLEYVGVKCIWNRG